MKVRNVTEFLLRCSSIRKALTNPQGKSPAEKYLDCITAIETKKAQYNGTVNKETKTAQKLLESIQKLNTDLLELEKHKDEKPLSATVKKLLAESHREIVWKRYESIGSKYTKKGNTQEDEGISIFHKIHPEFVFPERNTERFKNAFLTGMPDMKDQGIVIPFDIKCPWDWKTLPYPEEELDEVYQYQNFGYVDLFKDKLKTDTWTTFSVLVNTPPRLIEQEMNHLWYNLGCPDRETDEAFLLGCIEIEKNSIYDLERFKRDLVLSGYQYQFRIPEADWEFDVPVEERVIQRSSTWTQDFQDEIYARVGELRQELFKTYPKHWVMP